jgi:hypothetical protein
VVYSVTPRLKYMSMSENDQPLERFAFKGRFGASVPVAPPAKEASHEEVDAFVKSILGLAKGEKK